MIITYGRGKGYDDLSGPVGVEFPTFGAAASSGGGGTPGPGGIGEFGLRRAANVAVIGK